MYENEQSEVIVEETVDVDAYFDGCDDCDDVETEVAIVDENVAITADCDEDVETQVNIPQDNIEISTFYDVDESVRVQLITGLDLIHALPPGGTAGQILVKNSDKSQDVSWTDMPKPEVSADPIIKYPLIFYLMNNTYECTIPSPYRLISVKDNNHNDVLFESFITDKGIKIVVETLFNGYALVY